jgi:hypothetical protein
MPKDPIMLLSYVNTQLRDNYTSLDELCSVMSVEKQSILSTLAAVDYHYSSELNKFV